MSLRRRFSFIAFLAFTQTLALGWGVHYGISDCLGADQDSASASADSGLEERRQYLAKRYDVDPASIQFTQNSQYAVIVRGKDQKSFVPQVDLEKAQKEGKDFDVVVVGSGPAGLTSALYLTDQGKKVLLLERSHDLGGLGMGSELNHIRVAAGAAYSAGPGDKDEFKIFQHIGIGDYKKRFSIHEPIDSYLWNGKMYLGIWEDETLKDLPASFSLFKLALLRAAKKGSFERETELGQETDKMDFATFIRRMPEMVAKMRDPAAKKIYARFLADPLVNRTDPMKDVIGLLDLYGRSALGGEANKVSARQFGDFYASEIGTRYTGTFGTGTFTGSIIKKLKKNKDSISIHTDAPVAHIKDLGDSVLVTYVKEGKAIEVRAKKVVFSSPIVLAPHLIEDFEKNAPDRAAVINQMEMTDYAVDVVHVKGHPFRETYDLWLRPQNYTDENPTDVISGRWMDPKIEGYQGMRSFEKNPADDYGVLTIYHPIGLSRETEGMTNSEVLKLTENSVNKLEETLEPYLKEKFGHSIQIELVESERWPMSIHIVKPGMLEASRVLSKPLGNILFANNTEGGPEFEDALVRGKRAAEVILKALQKREAGCLEKKVMDLE